MSRSMIDLWVGIFVSLGIAALLFLALKVGNLATFSTSQTYQVDAKFANIGGLKVRGPVKSAGVVVGRVASIRFEFHGISTATVVLSLGSLLFAVLVWPVAIASWRGRVRRSSHALPA